MPNRRIQFNGLLTVFMLLLSVISVADDKQDQTDKFEESLTSGTLNLDIRYRYEMVDDKAPGLDKAKANTVRTRLGYETGSFGGFKLYTEMEDIRAVFGEQFNSTTNDKTRFATVPDPEETELNQLYLEYANNIGAVETLIRHGRQRQRWDNDRFIGNVGWRQNEQTYDGTLLQLGLNNSGLKFIYSRHTNVNRIFGDVADAAGDFNVTNNNFSLNYSGFKYLNATAYYFTWEGEDGSGPFSVSDSRKTKGIRLLGNFPVNKKFKLLGTVEYASQDDYKGAPSFSSLDYTLFEVGASFNSALPLTVKVGQETLEGNIADGESFITPFATLHAFQGWADVFVGSGITGLYGGQAAGIEDTYFSIGTNLYGIKLLAIYHEFEPDDSDSVFDNYGSEIDLLAVRTFAKKYSIGFKYADFNATDGFRNNNDKSIFWSWLEAKF